MFPYPNLLKDLSHYIVFMFKISFETFTDLVCLLTWWALATKRCTTKFQQRCLLHCKYLTYFVIQKTLKNKPSYLTEAWLPEEEELFDNKGVGLSNDRCLGFDDGSGSVCVWYCTLMSRLVALGTCSLWSVWLYFKEDSLELDALGGGAGMCLGLPVDVGQAQLLQLLIIIITKKSRFL